MLPPNQSGIDFSDYIADRTLNFTGRDWVFEEIQKWLADPKGDRFFLLTGEPGSGKTAIAARLAQFAQGTTTYSGFEGGFLQAVHFCDATQSGWIDPKNFSESISLQLAQIPAFSDALINIERSEKSGINISVEQNVNFATDSTVQAVVIKTLDVSGLRSGQDAFNQVVVNPLRTIYRNGFDQPIIILVDSLDEALIRQYEDNIVKLLGTLDRDIKAKFILTSRVEPKVRKTLDPSGQDKFQEIFLSDPKKLQQNQEDVRQYIKVRLEDENLQQQVQAELPSSMADLIAAITNKSAGNFLYIRFLLDAVASKKYKLTNLDELPSGLSGLYRASLQRVVTQSGKKWKENYAPLMGVLQVAQNSLTENQLIKFSSLDEDSMPDYLEELEQFLQRTNVDNEPSYRLYHQSVADFLNERHLDDNKRNRNDYFLDKEKQHQRITNYYYLESKLRSEIDVYGLRYLANHLQQAEQLEQLYDLARNESFANAQRKKLPNEPELLLKTIKLALQSEVQADHPGGMAALLLLHAERKKHILQETPLDILQRGHLEQAWNLAKQWNKEESILWCLLMVWVLITHNKKDQAQEILTKLQQIEPFPLLYWRSDYAGLILGHILPVFRFNYQLLIRYLENDELGILCKELIRSKKRDVLKLANEIAQQIENPYHKSNLLKEIAIAQVKTGYIDDSSFTTKQITQQIKDEEKKYFALSEIVDAQLEAGSPTDALSTAQMITVHQESVLKEIAITQLESKDFDTALSAVQQIKSTHHKSSLLERISAAQLECRNFDAALSTALKIEDLWRKRDAITKIAIAQLRAENCDAAFFTTQQIKDAFLRANILKEIAIAQFEAGSLDAKVTLDFALSATRQIEDVSLKESTLQDIAVAQFKIEDCDNALFTIQQIEDISRKAYALDEIAITQLKAGNLVAALSITQQIESLSYQADTFEKIAVIQFEAGDPTAALETLSIALSTAHQIKNLSSRSDRLAKIAITQFKFGDFSAARQTLNTVLSTMHKVKEEFWKKSVLEKIAIAQLESGDFNSALSTAQQLEDTHRRTTVLEKIAIAQLESRDSNSALSTAQQIEDAYRRTSVLEKIAIAQLESGEPTAAFNTIEQIEDKHYGPYIVKKIAIAQLKNGNFDVTFSMIQCIENESSRTELLRDIAIAQLEDGDFIAAQQSLDNIYRIENAYWKASALVKIAIAQFNAGKSDAAQSTLDTAFSTTQKVRPVDRNYVLKEIAIAQLKIGNFNAAFTVIESIKAIYDKANILKEIASAQLDLRNAIAAQETLSIAISMTREIENPLSIPSVLKDIAVTQLEVGNPDLARKNLEIALSIVQGKEVIGEDIALKDRLLEKIAIAQFESGDLDAALSTAEEIESASYKTSVLQKIAGVQLESRDLDLALSIAQKIVTESSKVDILKKIAIAQLANGETSAARKTLNIAFLTTQRIEDESRKSNLLREIAIAQLSTGDSNAALLTTQQIEDRWKEDVLKEIAISQFKAGNFDAAHSTIQQIETAWRKAGVLREIAISQFKAGNFDAALSTTQQIEDANALEGVAIAQLEAGSPETAQSTLKMAISAAEKIEEVYWQSYTLKRIAIAQLKIGDSGAAFSIAQQIKDASKKVSALKEISIAQFSDEDSNGAKITLDAALATIKQTEDIFKKSDMLRDLVIAQLEIGDSDAALSTSQQIEDLFLQMEDLFSQMQDSDEKCYAGQSYTRAMLCSIAMNQFEVENHAATLSTIRQIENLYDFNLTKALVVALFKAEELDTAQAILNNALVSTQQIEDVSHKSDILKEIAITQLEIGDSSSALSTAQQIEDEYRRTDTLMDIAMSQFNAGNLPNALSTINQIGAVFSRTDVLKKIAIAQLKARDSANALLVIDVIEDIDAKKEIAIAQIQAGNSTVALSIAEQIKDICARAKALKEIASVQLGVGNPDAAQMTLNIALDTAQQIDNLFSKATALREIAIVQFEARNAGAAQMTLNTALTVAQQIGSPSWKLSEIREVAIAQAKTGYARQAVETAKIFLINHNESLLSIAAACAEIKDKENFKKFLTLCDDSLESAYKMCHHLIQLYPNEAKKVGEEINNFTLSLAK